MSLGYVYAGHVLDPQISVGASEMYSRRSDVQ